MFILNKNQETIVEEGVDWFFNQSAQLFEIDGEAGTGKSVVLNEIVKRLGLFENEYMPMAYTGQASIVMRTKGFINAKSIHSSLYKIELVPSESVHDKNNPFTINTEFNRDNYVYIFRKLTRNDLQGVKLFIIDEAWMVPEQMKNHIMSFGIKVIAAGDSGQLPPVMGNPAFLTGYNVHHLTELMRQHKNSAIVYLAHRARHGEPIHCGVYGNEVLVIEDTDVTDQLMLNSQHIICGTNKSRDFFNKRIRDLKRIETPYPVCGDRIICRNNNWKITINNIALANGLQGIVMNPLSIGNYTNRDEINLDFLTDIMSIPFYNISINSKYIVSPYDIRNQIKNSKYTKGELFEYAYAITTHLSQGSEYPTGIYFEEFLRQNIQNQLNYTAITRFKQKMIYVKKSKKLF